MRTANVIDQRGKDGITILDLKGKLALGFENTRPWGTVKRSLSAIRGVGKWRFESILEDRQNSAAGRRMMVDTICADGYSIS
jgi:hypothetical protein